MTTLTVPSNASGILIACLSIWPPPKMPMENFGANCCLLIDTETPWITEKTKLAIIFSFWWGLFYDTLNVT